MQRKKLKNYKNAEKKYIMVEFNKDSLSVWQTSSSLSGITA